MLKSVIDEQLLGAAVDRLRAIAHEGRSVAADQVSVIGLEDIKAAVGPKWSELSGNILRNTYLFLEKRLSKDDFVIPCGDSFIIIYGGQTPIPPRNALASDLNAFYLARFPEHKLSASVDVAPLGPDSTLAPAPPSESSDLAGALDIRFRPVWNLDREAITSYILTPSSYQSSRRIFGYDSGYRKTGMHCMDSVLEVDRACAQAISGHANRMIQEGRRSLLGLCLHDTTLRPKGGMATVLAELAALSSDVRRHLMVRISEVQIGTPVATIGGWIDGLNRHVAGVFLELHPEEKEVRRYADLAAIGIGFCAHRLSDEKCARRIREWSEATRAAGRKMFVDHLNTNATLRAALASGVSFVSSELLWPATSSPGGVVRETRAQVLARMTAHSDQQAAA